MGWKSISFNGSSLAVCLLLAGSSAVLGADCNRNGTEDSKDIEAGTSADCNRNGVPDDCDIKAVNLAFGNLASYDVGSTAGSLACGDFDGDGDLDFAVSGEKVAVFLNDGSGHLGNARLFESPAPQGVLAAGDLSGDGASDLAFANTSRNEVAVLINSGDGRFARAATYPVGDQPVAILFEDFDRDGKLDLATANYNSFDASVLLNQGNGAFLPARTFPTGERPKALITADLDGDGSAEIAASNVTSHEISIVAYSRQGVFAKLASLQFGLNDLNDITSGDFDNDGDIDLAATAATSGLGFITVLLNHADGTFGRTQLDNEGSFPESISTADIDSDGDADLLVMHLGGNCPEQHSCALSIFPNRGDGTFLRHEEHELAPGIPSGTLIVKDLDGDGRLELAFTANYLGILHTVEILDEGETHSFDCNQNGVPDECDLANNDCNWNGIPDECDARSENAGDCNADGIPNDCELDCNANGSPDACEIAGGAVKDCNSNGIPDDCELGLHDRNRNGVPDDCDVQSGLSSDCNRNLVPDESDLEPRIDFAAPRSLALGFLPGGVAPADIDGDGNLDLAVTRGGQCCPFEPGKVAVFLNHGDGSLTAAGELAAAANPKLLAAADLDGDGDVDIAVAHKPLCCHGPGGLTLLFNGGKGRFSAPETVASLLDPDSLLAADLDRDGDNDLVVTSGTDLLVFRNEGARTFAPAGRIALNLFPRSPTAGDLDGDGDVDLALILSGNSSVSVAVGVLLNHGDGTFAEVVRYEAEHDLYHLAVGDIDGDGDLDLLTISDRSASFLFNDGRGVFSVTRSVKILPETGPALLADLDGDRDLDLVLAAHGVPVEITATGPGLLLVLLNKGDGGFVDTVEVARVGANPLSIWAGDLDGDGHPEILVPSSSGRDIAIFRNDGVNITKPINQVEIHGVSRDLRATDLDADGDLDLVSANAVESGLIVFSNDGDKTLRVAAALAVGYSQAGIALADFDGDRDLDLAVLGQDKLSLLLKDGGGFGAPRVIPLVSSSPPVVLVSGDFHGDGRVDLVAGGERDIRLFRNEGQAAFAEGEQISSGVPLVSLAGQDINGDGLLDLVSLHSYSDPEKDDFISVFVNTGGGAFAPARSFSADRTATFLAAGDLNGDGDFDFAVTNFSAGTVSILANDGVGRFAAPVRYAVGPDPVFVEAADFDRDGDLDLGVRRSFGRTDTHRETASDGFTLLTNRGDGTFDASLSFSFGWGPGTHVAADFDRDGDLDLAVVETVEAYRQSILVIENLSGSFSIDRNRNGVPDECEPAVKFRRADVNQDGARNITDAIFILRHLFQSGDAPRCEAAADSNDDGFVDVSDPISILRFLFTTEDPLPEPFLECGPDPTRDPLSCREFQPCVNADPQE